MSLRSLLVACAFASSLSCLPATADDFADVSKFIRAGQFNEAMAKVDAVLTQRPRDAQMRFLKGLILTEQNKNAEAITVFTKLTEDYPELPEPHNNLAVLYASSGQYDKARAALEAAIRTNPTYATAHENLGDVYAKLASQAYDKALQLDSGNNSAKSKLTMVRTLVGNTTSAALPKPGTTVASATPSKATTKPATPTPTPAAVATPVAVAPSPTPAALPTPIASAAASKASTLIAKAETKPEAKPEKPETKPEVKVEAKPDPKAEAKQKALEAKAAEKAAQEAKAAEKAERLAEAKAQEAKANVERDDVLKAVNSWAKAWSSKDMKGYLNAYGNDFQTPKGEPRKAWADERRQRIESKGRISVQVEEAQVKLEGNTATVKFRQIYTSDKLTANSRKILVLTKQGSKWQIKQERSAS